MSNVADIPLTFYERPYRRELRPQQRTRYWARRWASMPKKARERLRDGTMIECVIDIDELCANAANIPSVPFPELLEQLKHELASR